MKFTVLKDGDGILQAATNKSYLLETYEALEQEQIENYGFCTLSIEEVDITRMSADQLRLLVIDLICNNPEIGLEYHFDNPDVSQYRHEELDLARFVSPSESRCIGIDIWNT